MAAAAILKKIFMETITIQQLWQLLQPSMVFDTRGRYEKCQLIWEALDEAQHQRIYNSIAAKKQNGEFVHPNPCFALDDAMQDDECTQAKKKQTMTFAEYYAMYNTTEERDGWKMTNPTGEKVIYVKRT